MHGPQGGIEGAMSLRWTTGKRQRGSNEVLITEGSHWWGLEKERGGEQGEEPRERKRESQVDSTMSMESDAGLSIS